MTIVGEFVFPHGTTPLDPQVRDFANVPAARPTTKEECIKLHKAMRQTAVALIETQPELIVFSTPHGIKIENSYAIYDRNKAEGDADWHGEWRDYKASFEIDVELSEQLARYLQKSGNTVSLLKVGLEFTAIPLKWAEVVPFWFITEEAKKVNFQLPKVIAISLPFEIKDKRSAAIPTALKIGSDIYDFINSNQMLSSKRIALVTSLDLSHNHSSAATSPYPYLPFANKFDEPCQEWAKLDINAKTIEESNDLLLRKAAEYVDQVECCGYIGVVIVQGLLQREIVRGTNFKATYVYYSAPAYFGMMASYHLRI
ncbi:hypothetical protein B4U79_17352 [Dinothrombium tinctorium]|uniref:Extradiol ring-cleavage dioxygenase class III enzyme subunit B domain-containing protein n=1 Tax=Dinothrombium tinctorium TaxID=1965070 RepID=A0A443RCC5_9ACAR|nr:hypothetical protein B4U79_17403 [Dinothrombium tinctorium]RWS12929.1 hypothetical protein B4U79_17401 [Dinothrombium tinctorium]RWS13542.1 hypothetical protein B4U79_17352 [Dinothrombium tinctorium]